MSGTKVTGEIAIRVWEQLDQGKLPVDTDAPSERAGVRLRGLLGRFDGGFKGGELGKEWPKLSKILYPFYQEYRKLHPKPILTPKLRPRPSRRVANSPAIPDISPLLDSMWVPDPDKIDLLPFDTGSGPRTNRVDGRRGQWV